MARIRSAKCRDSTVSYERSDHEDITPVLHKQFSITPSDTQERNESAGRIARVICPLHRRVLQLARQCACHVFVHVCPSAYAHYVQPKYYRAHSACRTASDRRARAPARTMEWTGSYRRCEVDARIGDYVVTYSAVESAKQRAQKYINYTPSTPARFLLPRYGRQRYEALWAATNMKVDECMRVGDAIKGKMEVNWLIVAPLLLKCLTVKAARLYHCCLVTGNLFGSALPRALEWMHEGTLPPEELVAPNRLPTGMGCNHSRRSNRVVNSFLCSPHH